MNKEIIISKNKTKEAKQLKVKVIKDVIKGKLKPQRLKGFNDWFAGDMKLREYVISVFKKVFESYGYEPLETPALEYTQMMLDISGDEAESLFYRFKDPGGRDVMLKYEVMTGMCRAVAQNISNLPMPYKRYQIQRVWRSENTQRGRYREFTQCDADTIGTTSMQADAEFIEMGIEITGKLGFKDYIARISNRKFLAGIAQYLDIPEQSIYGFFMSIDKLSKIGVDQVIEEMTERRGVTLEQAKKCMQLIEPSQFEKMAFVDVANSFMNTIGKTEIGKEGLDELVEIDRYLKMSNFDEKYYRFDTTIARGLASYTGPIWEFDVIDGGVGSIAGCGRYDKLIGRYVGRDVPSTGGSFGIERVCDIIKDQGIINLGKTTIDLLVTIFAEDLFENSLKVASQFREKGISTLVYPEVEKVGKQLQYADKKGIPWVIVVGSDEVKQNKVQLKNMKTGEQSLLSVVDAIETVM
ncbi:histidine--tRNA ligase [Candidatus Dojkabacteria bacterium]|nr:histidine--tRNA ligase [Candidatus Dojkabacteria bacterium]